MIKKNNTKATINGDKECLLVTESFVNTGPSESGVGGGLPQPLNFGRDNHGEAVAYAPPPEFSDLPTALGLLIRSASLPQKLRTVGPR